MIIQLILNFRYIKLNVPNCEKNKAQTCDSSFILTFRMGKTENIRTNRSVCRTFLLPILLTVKFRSNKPFWM